MTPIEILTLCEKALWTTTTIVPLGAAMWRAIEEWLGSGRPNVRMFAASRKTGPRRLASAA
jgi:hypothetical protein